MQEFCVIFGDVFGGKSKRMLVRASDEFNAVRVATIDLVGDVGTTDAMVNWYVQVKNISVAVLETQ